MYSVTDYGLKMVFKSGTDVALSSKGITQVIMQTELKSNNKVNGFSSLVSVFSAVIKFEEFFLFNKLNRKLKKTIL